jgi:hypothetical protein
MHGLNTVNTPPSNAMTKSDMRSVFREKRLDGPASNAGNTAQQAMCRIPAPSCIAGMSETARRATPCIGRAAGYMAIQTGHAPDTSARFNTL